MRYSGTSGLFQTVWIICDSLTVSNTKKQKALHEVLFAFFNIYGKTFGVTDMFTLCKPPGTAMHLAAMI